MSVFFKQGNLFSLNIRDYLGIVKKDSNVNNNIQQTAAKEPQQFWPFNNGLTIITHKYVLDGDYLTVTGLAIVNGAQTTGAIGNLEALRINKRCSLTGLHK